MRMLTLLQVINTDPYSGAEEVFNPQFTRDRLSTERIRREYVEPNALKEWNVSIFKIVDKHIKFYSQNTNLLPLNLNPLSDI